MPCGGVKVNSLGHPVKLRETDKIINLSGFVDTTNKIFRHLQDFRKSLQENVFFKIPVKGVLFKEKKISLLVESNITFKN